MSEDTPDFSLSLARFYGAATLGTLTKRKGDASARRYYRFVVRDLGDLELGQPASLIVMHLPEAADTLTAGRAQAEAFVDVQRLLVGKRIAVPAIFACDLDAGTMLLEDLGDETFGARLEHADLAAWPELYGAAIDLLADMHEACSPPGDPAASIAFRRSFEPTLVRFELDHFREHGLEALAGPLGAADRAELDGHFDALTAVIDALPKGFVHRDYQSRNLMWAPSGALTVIDFQDAMIGPAPYDLVALLCDSYVVLDAASQRTLLERYARRRGLSDQAQAACLRGFQLIAAQRKLKDAGRFVFLDRVRGNPDFLPFFTQSLRYADRALASLPELAPLRATLQRLLPGFPELAAPRAGR